MSYFNPAFLKFFRELAANNTKTWFDENRKTYETEVKKPFSLFVEEMITRIQKHEPEVQIKPSEAIMRINRDIRFSKDKTPYNTYVAANISVFGKKDKSYPGFYFQLSPAAIAIYGGAYMVEKDKLQNIRKYIAGHQKEFSEVYNDKTFKEKFAHILGDQNKRIPPEFKEVEAQEPLIANKQFYYSAELPHGDITSPALADKLMDYYQAGKGVNDFLKRAMEG